MKNMAQVLMPQKKNNDSELFQLAGGIAGGILGTGVGGPGAGTAAGAALGSQLGGTAGNLLTQTPSQGQSPSIGGEGQAAAMARRQQQMSQDNLATLKQAEGQLPQLPEELRQQYAPAIVQARMMEEKKRGGMV